MQVQHSVGCWLAGAIGNPKNQYLQLIVQRVLARLVGLLGGAGVGHAQRQDASSAFDLSTVDSTAAPSNKLHYRAMGELNIHLLGCEAWGMPLEHHVVKMSGAEAWGRILLIWGSECRVR